VDTGTQGVAVAFMADADLDLAIDQDLGLYGIAGAGFNAAAALKRDQPPAADGESAAAGAGNEKVLDNLRCLRRSLEAAGLPYLSRRRRMASTTARWKPSSGRGSNRSLSSKWSWG
jgi:hypothetical protein